MPNTTTPEESHKLWLLFLIGITLLYCMIVAGGYHLPFLDLPNHAARAHIIGSQIFSSVSHPHFTFDWAFRPYILGDLTLASLVHLFGYNEGSLALMLVALLLPPIAMWTYLTVRGAKLVQKRIAVLMALFLATNWFFLNAYIHFAIGCSLSLLALAFLELVATRPSAKALASFLVASVFAYLFHTASFMFLCIMGGFSMLWLAIEERKIQKLFWLTPLVLLGIHYLWLKQYGTSVLHVWLYRPLGEKLLAGGSLFYRFDLLWDALLVVLFLGVLLFCERSKTRESKNLSYYLYMTITLIVCYFTLPKAAALTVSDIDTRALPFGFFFAVCSSTTLQISSPRSRLALSLASVLLLLNGLYLHFHLKPHEEFLSNYSTILSMVPEGAKVLPVNTRSDTGRMQTSQHPTAEASVTRNAFVPYILSSRAGEPVTYFHYKETPELPSAFWYTRNQTPNWDSFLGFFSHLCVTKPLDTSRLPMKQLSKVAENKSAVLFRINSDSPSTQSNL